MGDLINSVSILAVQHLLPSSWLSPGAAFLYRIAEPRNQFSLDKPNLVHDGIEILRLAVQPVEILLHRLCVEIPLPLIESLDRALVFRW